MKNVGEYLLVVMEIMCFHQTSTSVQNDIYFNCTNRERCNSLQTYVLLELR